MTTAVKMRKQFILEPGKIRSVKERLKVKTDTEAVSKAMDIVIANSRIKETLMSIKGKGQIKDIYGKSPR